MVQDRGPPTSAVTIIVTVLATVFIAARFYTRIWLVKCIRRDDWWILAAWVLAVGFSTSICIAVKYGLGKHKDDISDASFSSLRKAEYTFSILYNPALMLTKTSIIVFYLSVMSKDVDPVFKWCNWLTLALVNIVGTALTFFNIFQCRPVAAGYQDATSAKAKCTDIVTLYLSSAPVNIITDIAILFLPMPILTRMRLPRKQKIILVVTFSFGAFAAVVDVVRIAYLQNAALNLVSGNKSRVVEQNDFSWSASLSFMWSAVEVCIGIICACVPSLKPLFSRFLPRFIRDPGDMSVNGSIDHGPSTATATATSISTFALPPQSNVSMVTHPAAFRKAMVKEYAGDDDGDQMGFLNMQASPPLEGEGETDGDGDGDGDGSRGSFTFTRRSTRLTRRATNKSHKTTTSASASDFKFVKMAHDRNMLKLTTSQSLWPIAVVTVVFFLWGFAYGLLDTLNSRFQSVAGLSQGQGLGLHASYYAGYLVGPLTLGLFVLKRYGFKATMISGLCVYGCGTLVFWPSAVLTSYGAFIVSNFIVGFGLSLLEVAANPYIALCGPMEFAEVRLNVAQAVQAIGTVCSPLLATLALFRHVQTAEALVGVQWTYLGIALFVFAMAVVFYYIPLPEATDRQLAELVDGDGERERRNAVDSDVDRERQSGNDGERRITTPTPYSGMVGSRIGNGDGNGNGNGDAGCKVIYLTLALGVFSQWCYVGLQECVGNNFQALITLLMPPLRSGSGSSSSSSSSSGSGSGSSSGSPSGSALQPFYLLTIAHSVFSAGRFLTAGLNYFVKPRWVLLGLYAGLVVCLALNMTLGGGGGGGGGTGGGDGDGGGGGGGTGGDGDAAAALAILTFFFESGIFSNIFAISLRRLGVHTKLGAALMTAAISGGAVWPPVQWAVSEARGLRYSYCVPLAVGVAGMLFPVYLGVVPLAGRLVDPVRDRDEQRERQGQMSIEQGGIGIGGHEGHDQNTNILAPSMPQRKGKRRRKRQGTMSLSVASVEHVERQQQQQQQQQQQKQQTNGHSGFRGRKDTMSSSSPIFTLDFADDYDDDDDDENDDNVDDDDRQDGRDGREDKDETNADMIVPGPVRTGTISRNRNRDLRGYIGRLAPWPTGTMSEGGGGDSNGQTKFTNTTTTTNNNSNNNNSHEREKTHNDDKKGRDHSDMPIPIPRSRGDEEGIDDEYHAFMRKI